MKLILLIFAGLAVATPLTKLYERQGQSFACQHDHLHTNPECSKGAAKGAGPKAPGGLGAPKASAPGPPAPRAGDGAKSK